MSIGIERIAGELIGRQATGEPARNGSLLRDRLSLWEDLLTLVVEPESSAVRDRERKRTMLSRLLERAGLNPEQFWKMGRARRGRTFLARYSRVSKDIPQLEITSFDVDKALKERFRQEPLTVGAAWHHGFWRSYFSHAAITHPANDGLREEFSTAWDIARKHPAVLFRTGEGAQLLPLRSIRLDLPMLVGPLPMSDGITLERAYLEAMEAADPKEDLLTRSLLVMPADACLASWDELRQHAASLMPRLSARHALLLADEEGGGSLREIVNAVRIAELEWSPDLADAASAALRTNPELLLSVHLRFGGGFWEALEQAVGLDGAAMIHVHSGAEKSYRLIPQVDAFLKARLIRARVQLVNAGGDSDTQASAATVYESVLLGANGGSMTDIAGIALLPELVDVYHGAPLEPMVARLREADPAELRKQAVNTLTCWQHSILDFLSCMGIDDIQKTSGNTMAITMTEDWIRDVDRLATTEFGTLNRELNRRRIEAEPAPNTVREAFKVSSMMKEVEPDLPLVLAARVMAHENTNYHLMNSNRGLNADFLEVVYRMAAGEAPREEDFFIEGDLGPLSMDAIGLRLSRESLRWSLRRLAGDPRRLDYVSLAVPRGFFRAGAVPPGAAIELRAEREGAALESWTADARGGFEHRLRSNPAADQGLEADRPMWIVARDGEDAERVIEMAARGHGAHGRTVLRASADGAVTIRRDPAASAKNGGGDLVISGFGFREPIWHGPVSHASISLGAASEDFLVARMEGNSGLSMTSSGEGGPIRLSSDEDMKWESLQAASGHFGIHARDLRRVRDVEIKINQGAKPGKGGRLSGAKVTATVSKARNIPVGTDALSPDPKHDIYSIEDMPAEVWLWLLYHNHCGIKITGSNYTKYVAAGMWSNFVVDYLLIDSGLGGSGNYHADSSHVGWPDIFRTILHTHHALVHEKVDLGPVLSTTGTPLDGAESGPRTIRDLNGTPFNAGGGTRLFASGGLRGELDMLKVLIAGADGLVEASIGKAVAFGCNQCGNCHLDCPRGGITTKHELTLQNDRALMRRRFRNWTALNMVKLAVLIDALNRDSGALGEDGRVERPEILLDDIRMLRGRTDLLTMPQAPAREPARIAGAPEPAPLVEVERDSCRVGSLAVSEPVTVHAIWEAACRSYNGGNNRGGGIDFAGFAPEPVREKTCLIFNTIGPDRAQTIREMLGHLGGCRFFDAAGVEHSREGVVHRLGEFKVPVRDRYAGEDGWRAADLRENPGDFHVFFVELKDDVLRRYGRTLVQGAHWLQRRTKYGDIPDPVLMRALESIEAAFGEASSQAMSLSAGASLAERLTDFVTDVREEYFTALAHLLDSRYYRTHAPAGGAPAGKYAAKRRGFVVSIGEDIGAIKISGWTHTIPEYFDFDRFWAGYAGALERGGVETTVKGRTSVTPAFHARVWGMHHRYPTNSPAIDAEGRGNPAGAHPFKAYNLLLMHNGEQVGVDSTSPFLNEFGFVHADPSMGEGADRYHGDSVYERKALTDTEYAAYLADFTRRVLGLTTEEASQIISPITGIDLEAMDPERRAKLQLLMTNYVQLTPTGPYKFTIVESRRRRRADSKGGSGRVVGFRENTDIKFLRPHEIVASIDPRESVRGTDGAAWRGVQAVANGSEAKIADAMLRVLHAHGILGDGATDLRFNMRPGGNPERRDYGGVVEVFTDPAGSGLDLRNRFGEVVPVDRAGAKVDLERSLEEAVAAADPEWKRVVNERLEQLGRVLAGAGGIAAGRLFGPEDSLPAPANELIESTLERAGAVTFDDYRFLAEHALPRFAAGGDPRRAAALRILTELRKRLTFCDLGGKALSSMEYLTDGGRTGSKTDGEVRGAAEGGIYRILDQVPLICDAFSDAQAGAARAGGARYVRATAETRDDLAAPRDPARDVLVIDFAGFKSESFLLDSASRIVSEAVRIGWRQLIGFDFAGGPRYVGTNLCDAHGAAARGVVIELYGREFGDFVGALVEGAEIWAYGQGQSHWGLKADSGSLFVLQDCLNTCTYAAHGGTMSVWDSGSRFAAAGQNKVVLEDGKSPAPGFKSIHFGSPNEYAFEYLMSGGENSLHVVLGLRKPDARGELSLRPKPYAGKFLMSGAAAGRLFVFDPMVKLDPAQYRGNVLSAIGTSEWSDELAPFLAREAKRRGLPLRIEGEHVTVRLDGNWKRWRYDEAFAKLVPIKVAKAAQQQGIVPKPLAQIVGE